MNDYLVAARAGSRDLFVQAYPFPFLVGFNALDRPSGRRQTLDRGPSDFEGALTTRVRLPGGQEPVLQVFAVRKVQAAFPSMITVGRGPNNDIVLEDTRISKFHAYFREHADHFELSDSDSLNGTFVGGLRLMRGAPGVPVISGDEISFSSLRFEFLDAGACFDWLRELPADTHE